MKWCDGFRLSAMGIVLASKKPKFWIVFLLSFAVFGTLLALLAGGKSSIDLFFAADFGGKFKIIGDAFLSLFIINRAFIDWLMIFGMAFLQSLLIALIALVWKKKRTRKSTSNKQRAAKTEQDASIQNAGIVAGLAILGSGCPTCGTSLIAPILGAVFSTGSYSLLNTITWIITLIAVVIAILSIKRVGEEAYVIMIDEEWNRNHPKEGSHEK